MTFRGIRQPFPIPGFRQILIQRFSYNGPFLTVSPNDPFGMLKVPFENFSLNANFGDIYQPCYFFPILPPPFPPIFFCFLPNAHFWRTYLVSQMTQPTSPYHRWPCWSCTCTGSRRVLVSMRIPNGTLCTGLPISGQWPRWWCCI